MAKKIEGRIRDYLNATEALPSEDWTNKLKSLIDVGIKQNCTIDIPSIGNF